MYLKQIKILQIQKKGALLSPLIILKPGCGHPEDIRGTAVSEVKACRSNSKSSTSRAQPLSRKEDKCLVENPEEQTIIKGH